MSRTQSHPCRRSLRLAWLVVLTLGMMVLPRAVRAAGTPVPPKRHAEELVFDEKTGQWRQIVEPVPGTEDGDLDIARQWLSRGEYKTVLKIVKAWMSTYGTSAPRYPEALYLKGTAYLERGLYKESHEAYQALLNDFPASPYAEDALSGDFRVAEQYLAGKRKRVWGGLLWFRDREGGVTILDEIIANYSDTPLAEMAQMAKAEYYYGRGDFELAESEYATFARNYPRSRWHGRALLMSARSALARFPGVKFDDAALIEAQERFQQFQREYPAMAEQQGTATTLKEIASTRADKTLDIGKFYQKTGHPQAAKFYYREITIRWPGTPASIEARRRLTALGEPAGDEAAETPQASAFRSRAEEPR
jgi:outer membrane assembly lipoprotein YfiO